MEDRMPPKTLGGNSSVERVIKCKDGRTRIRVIKGGGGACRKVHSMQRHETVPNTAFYEQEEQKLTTPTNKRLKKLKQTKPAPSPKNSPSCAFFFKAQFKFQP